MPEPWGFYFAGSFGSWIFLVMNIAASRILWHVDHEVAIVINKSHDYQMQE